MIKQKKYSNLFNMNEWNGRQEVDFDVAIDLLTKKN